MRSTIRLAVFVATTAIIAACSMPTSPSAQVCRSAKIPGAGVCASKDYINPNADYINPNARSDSDSTQR